MIELRILSGKQAGAIVVARRFPFLVGRASDSGLRLDDEGVFDRHFRIEFQPREGFLLVGEPNAVTAVNNQTTSRIRLRSGDIIYTGSVTMSFGLRPPEQRSLRIREAVVWIMLAFLCLGQVAVIYWLLQN